MHISVYKSHKCNHFGPNILHILTDRYEYPDERAVFSDRLYLEKAETYVDPHPAVAGYPLAGGGMSTPVICLLL